MSFRYFAGTAATALLVSSPAWAEDAFTFEVGGRVQADYSRFDGIYTNNGHSSEAAYLRRAYLELSGRAFSDWKYTVDYDFSHNSGRANDGGYFEEASVTYTGFDAVELQIGRFDPEFGLEKATASKWVTAPERNAAFESIEWANRHQSGYGVAVQAKPNDAVYASVGLFSKDANEVDSNHQKQVNLRAVFAPLHESGDVLHVGANFARRDVSDSAIDTRLRSRLGMRGVDTNGGRDAGSNGNRVVFGGDEDHPAGSFDHDTAWGFEAAWARGPLSLQGEYMRARLKADTNAYQDITSSGYYAQAAYTITGESRQYKTGQFDAIEPSNKQYGAWEVFYRYDSLKVDDDNGAFADIGDTKGKVHNLGVNWYANENVKVTAAYVRARVKNITNDEGDDKGDGFVLRGQYQF
ncbi:OprO/OprP family phosphate-selective porin [Pseudomonas sp. Marseille-QA0892]